MKIALFASLFRQFYFISQKSIQIQTGMNLDDKLLLNRHVDTMIKKAKCKLGILYKIRKFISCETSLLIYKVMIRPHMEYGDFVVESSSKAHIDKLERLQEKSLRLAEYHSPEKKEEYINIKINFLY